MSLDNRSLKSNLLSAVVAQGVSFICSVVMSLFVPKVLGVRGFGFWQLFIFYTSYVSFFQLGLNDGIYLQLGGKKRSELDKSRVKSEFLIGCIFQSTIALFIGGLSIINVSDPQRTFVLVMSMVFMVISNATFFLGYVFQAVNETRLFSRATMVDRISFLIPLAVFVAVRMDRFWPYIVFFTISRLISLVYSLWNARDTLAVPVKLTIESIVITLESMKTGLVLTLANICFMAIMGFARFMIDAVWGIEAFGELSLALSLVNFALVFISQVGMVLFPALRRETKPVLIGLYRVFRRALCTALPFSYIAYYPIRLFASIWLPQYEESLYYLVFLMPICIFGVLNNILYTTYFKVENDPKGLLKVNLISFIASALGVLIGVYVYHSVVACIMFAIIGIAVCLVLSDLEFIRRYRIEDKSTFLGYLAMCFGLVWLNSSLSFLSALVATSVLLLFWAIFNRRTLKSFAKVACQQLGHRT